LTSIPTIAGHLLPCAITGIDRHFAAGFVAELFPFGLVRQGTAPRLRRHNPDFALA
jgi:hypothetical protein